VAFVWSSAIKDLRRRLRDPAALVIWMGIPFVVLALLQLAFGGGDIQPRAQLLVVNEDDSFLGGLLVGALGQGPLADMIAVEEVERAAGLARIGRGDASALLIVPAGFGSAVLNATPCELQLLTNPAQRILPGILEETLGLGVDAVFYLQELFGDPLRAIAAGPDGELSFQNLTISAIAVEINETIGGLAGQLLPPKIALETTVEPSPTAGLDFGTLFFQGMLFMAIVFMAQGMSGDVWEERLHGTLRRVLTTPKAAPALLAGKLLAGAAVFAALALLALPAGALLFDLSWRHLPLAMVWTVFSGTLLMTLFTLLQLLPATQRGASVLSSLVLFPLILLGGNFFPFEAMPEFLARIGRWTPNGWALEQLKVILAGGAEPGPLAAATAGLTLVMLLCFWLSARRMRRGFAVES